MSSYNMIPVTDLLIHGYTTGIATTTWVSDVPVSVDDGVSAQVFNTLVPGSPALTPYQFYSRPGTGMWYQSAGSTGLDFNVGSVISARLSFRPGAGFGLNFGLTSAFAQFIGSNAGVSMLSNGAFGYLNAVWNSHQISTVNAPRIGGMIAFLGSATFMAQGFTFINAVKDLIITVSTTNITVPATLNSTWTNLEGQFFTKPGLLQQTTTTITPSVARSGAHITNLTAGITTVFVTLPTATAGVEHIVSNARAVVNTVVISPRAAGDQLNVFGLTKAAGASVSGSDPFVSITFHCVTTSRWVATKQLGTWV